jgi:small conductance mechanosensitive channel
LKHFFQEGIDWLIDAVPNLIAAILILCLGYIIAGWVSRVIGRMMKDRKGVDGTLTPVIAALARYAILIILL